MQFRSEDLDADATYKLLSGVVVPRPIAWVTTISPGEVVNLAPFSAFTFVSSRPPMVAISIGRKAGVLKDTARNIRDRKEFVVNIADWSLLEKLHLSATEYPPDRSEVDELGLATVPSERVAPPRLAAAPVSLECRLHQAMEFGELKTALVVGEVLLFHVRDALCVDGKIRTSELHPIARLGGPNYATLGQVVTLPPIAATPKGAKPVTGEVGFEHASRSRPL